MHTTTREANDRGYECLVVSDCVGSYFPEFQRIGLEMIKAQGGIFGWVADSTAVIPALRTHSPLSACLRGLTHDAPKISDPPSTDPPRSPRRPSPWWTRGDTNAFFGLGFNILVNVLTLTGLMIGVIAVPAGDVLGTVLPALGVALILGNLLLHLPGPAARQAARTGTDVTALPYGPTRAAHVHRGVRRDAAGVPEHRQDADAGVAGRPGVGVHDRRHRDDRRLRRAATSAS